MRKKTLIFEKELCVQNNAVIDVEQCTSPSSLGECALLKNLLLIRNCRIIYLLRMSKAQVNCHKEID
jgi:hypothetical protein